MKATITNLGAVPIPLTSSDGAGLAAQIEPGGRFVLDDKEILVVTAGDNPSFKQDLTTAIGNLYKVALTIIMFWRAHPQPAGAQQVPVVSIGIVAHPLNGIRVTSDDKNLDYDIPPGGSYDATRNNYIELRELGGGGPADQPEAP